MAPVNQREVAHRLFAAEYNAARVEIKGADERAPSYVVSPLGAKVNRIFFCGVLTEVENKAQEGEMWRARISDPTGVFTVYAGQYQPEAATVLSTLSPPQYVAVVGKCRTYEPEPGNVFVSVRPETVAVVDEDVRNQWVFDTARHTWARVQAMRQAASLSQPSLAELHQLGLPPLVAAGVQLARERYGGDVDVDFFERLVRDALSFLVEDGKGLGAAAPPPPLAAAKPKPRGPGEEIEQRVLTYVESMAAGDEKGAQWDRIVAQGEKDRLTEEQIEEALNALMDKGLIYEPILGRLKMT